MQDNFYTMGFKSTSALQNIGTYLLVALIGIGVFLILFLIRLLIIKCPRAHQIYMKVYDSLVLSSVLRPLMQSYLTVEMSIFLSFFCIK